MVGYVLHELERVAMAPPSLVKYLSEVSSLHRIAGHVDPVKDPFVQLVIPGHRAHALETAGGELELQRMPLPAAFILRVCDLGLATLNVLLLLQCAGLVLAFILFNRPGAAACMGRCDVSFTAHGLELQVVDFKLALRTGRERLTFTVPINVDPPRSTRSPRCCGWWFTPTTRRCVTPRPCCLPTRRSRPPNGGSGSPLVSPTPGCSACSPSFLPRHPSVAAIKATLCGAAPGRRRMLSACRCR